MRWDMLFEDLAAQWSAEESAEARAELVDRTRRERSTITVVDRLAASVGGSVTLALLGRGGVVSGRLIDLGKDWVVIAHAGGSEVVHLAVIQMLEGVSDRADDRPGVLARRFGLGFIVRRLAQDRIPVTVSDVHGTEHSGTIDVVGKDFIEMAVHHIDVTRRATNVRTMRMIPFWSLASVRGR